MIAKGPFETDAHYQKRKWFIKNYSKYQPKDTEAEAERLSNIWMNMVTLKCRYNKPIESKIYNFLKESKKK